MACAPGSPFTARGVKRRCSQVWLARQASVLGARLEQGIAEATLEAAEPHCIRNYSRSSH